MDCLINKVYYSIFGPRFYPVSQIERQANPGDLIAFDRGGLFQHYALYIGNGQVINVGAEDRFARGALVTEMNLDEVAGRSYARIENHDEFASQFYHKLPPHHREIIERARRHVGRCLPYEFSFRNCEYYCTLWRFGVGFSSQVMTAKQVSGKTRYDKFAEHCTDCSCTHNAICHCTGEQLQMDLQILDLLVSQ